MTHQAPINVVACLVLALCSVYLFLFVTDGRMEGSTYRRTDVRTDTMCKNNDHLYGRGLVGQFKWNRKMKYILVTGGVISGIGKGVVASSVGVILKHCKLNVTSIKIDPYINIDAGTFSPYEHGEVYVLDDGGEVDLDLGNYER